MTGPGAPPDGRGCVRVDARAAAAKLRDHLLPEPLWYVLELVRGAVAGGATALALDNDADDLVLTFDGAPLAPEVLAGLLDQLFNAREHRVRLFALALNAALATAPRFVDFYTSAHDGDAATVVRVRWRPHAAPDGELALGPPPELAPVARPAGFPARGMRVHVRERFGARVVTEWLRGAPAERVLLLERVGALAVPLQLAGRAAAPPAAPLTGVIAVRGFAPEPGLRGWVALMRADARADVLELCEHGVTLEVRALSGAVPGAAAGGPHGWPLWVRVDADELPTNASRSRVNLEGGFGRALWRLCEDALAALVRTLVAQGGAADPGARAPLLALLAAADPAWAHRARENESLSLTAPLLDLPLVPLAAGGAATPRALAELAARRPIRVWTGDAAPDPALAPWLEGVVWRPPGDAAVDPLRATLPTADAAAAVVAARAALDRYQRFLAHPPRAPRVPPRPRDELLRVRFGAPGAGHEPAPEVPPGVHGELVVWAPRGSSPGSVVVTPYVAGRPLGGEFATQGGLEVDVALAAPDLRPRPGFEGVERDAAFERACDAATRVLAEALRYAATCPSPPLPDDPRASWLGAGHAKLAHDEPALARTARACWLHLAARGGAAPLRPGALAELAAAEPALADVPAWRTCEPALHLSTAAVRALAARGPLAYVAAAGDARVRSVESALTLVLGVRERDVLAALLPADARFLHAGARAEPVFAPVPAPPSPALPPRAFAVCVTGMESFHGRGFDLDAERDGYAGEVVLLPPGAAPAATVQWYRDHRPLGTGTVPAPWPAVVALEVPGLAPNATHTAPRPDPAHAEACAAVATLVTLALARELGPPSDAFCAVPVHVPASPAYVAGAARAVGWLWIPRDPVGRSGVRVARGPGTAAAVLPAHLAVAGGPARPLPVAGKLWLAGAPDDAAARSLVAAVTRWGYGAMLDAMTAELATPARGDAALAHLARAAATGTLVGEAARAWAGATRVPGAALTFAALGARAGRPLRAIDAAEASPPSGDAIVRTAAPWFAALVRAGVVADARPPPTPPTPPPPPAPRDDGAPPRARSFASAATPPAADDARAPAARLLDQLGLPRDALRAVEVRAGDARDPAVGYDPALRVATVRPDHARLAPLAAAKPARTDRVLAIALLAAINRALGEVTDADETRMLQALLAEMAAEARVHEEPPAAP